MCFRDNWESSGMRKSTKSKKAKGKAPAIELPADDMKISDLFTMRDERASNAALTAAAAAVTGGQTAGHSNQPANLANKKHPISPIQYTQKTQVTSGPSGNSQAARAPAPNLAAVHPPRKSKLPSGKGKGKDAPKAQGRSSSPPPRLAIPKPTQ